MSLNDAGITPDPSVMAFFSPKTSNPTALSKLRPQVGGALLFMTVATLMAVCPYLCFLWYLASIVACLQPELLDPLAVQKGCYRFFLRLSIFLFVRAPGLKVHLYGDAKDIMARDESVIYMSNHQSSVDWLVASILAMRARCLERIKFIMKQELHWVPIVGYYMKVVGHIYVRRRGFKPDRLVENLESVKRSNTPIWLAIFPEGTRYNPEDRKAIDVSEEMARSSHQQPLQHQLTPRPKGSWLMLDNLRTHVKALYSVTLVYDQPEPRGQRKRPPTATDVLRGACSHVHVHVKRIPIEDVPKEESAFLPWLHAEFQDRDRRLAAYYSTRSFASWGPSLDEAVDPNEHMTDVAWVVLMALGLLSLSLVRKMYLLTMVVATVMGYYSLQTSPGF